MKVLIACEFSGVVRDAFIAKGHDAMSCDFLPTERPGPHYQGDIFDILYSEHFDMMIAHPSCQYLTWAGIGYFNIERYGARAIERHKKREEALSFFMELYNAPIAKICIENPRGYAGNFIKPTQTIHPYWFGEEHKKLTCLWLKNLKPLQHFKETDLFAQRTWSDEPQPIYVDKSGKARYFTDAMPRKADRAHKRSVTFQGIANAMAEQWG
jgi:hypothetical protein